MSSGNNFEVGKDRPLNSTLVGRYVQLEGTPFNSNKLKTDKGL
jgi:hypothetical protein